jgi:hypothetical protein
MAVASRTSRRHRAEILEFLGVRRLTRRDLADASSFAAAELCPRGLTPGAMIDRLISWFFERKIECPAEDELARVTGGARRRFEERVLDAADGLLPETLKAALDASLADTDPVTGFTGLKADPARPIWRTSLPPRNAWNSCALSPCRQDCFLAAAMP